MISLATFRLIINMLAVGLAFADGFKLLSVNRTFIIKAITVFLLSEGFQKGLSAGLFFISSNYGVTEIYGIPFGVFYTLGDIVVFVSLVVLSLALWGVIGGETENEKEVPKNGDE